MAQQIKYSSLSIFLGGGCNLNCSYCFVDKENLEKIKPNISEIKKGIDFFLAKATKNPTINFTGGEPLLYWGILKELMEYLRKKKRKIFLIVSTNATLLDKEKSEFLKKYNVGLSVSLDGKQEINDLWRVFKNKKDSVFETVWKNIENLDKKRIKISSVFFPETVSQLTENIKFFIKKGFQQFDFYPEIYSLWSNAQLKTLKKSFDEFAEFFTSTPSIRISFLDSMLKKNTENFCCQMLNLSPEGNFYLCDKVFSFFDERRKKYLIGDGQKGIDEKKRENLLKKAKKGILKETDNKCLKCSQQIYCFCPIGLYLWSKENKKDFQKLFQTFCKISKIYISTFLKLSKRK